MTSHPFNSFPVRCESCGTEIKKHFPEFLKIYDEIYGKKIMVLNLEKLKKNEKVDEFFKKYKLRECCVIKFLTYSQLPFPLI